MTENVTNSAEILSLTGKYTAVLNKSELVLGYATCAINMVPTVGKEESNVQSRDSKQQSTGSKEEARSTFIAIRREQETCYIPIEKGECDPDDHDTEESTSLSVPEEVSEVVLDTLKEKYALRRRSSAKVTEMATVIAIVALHSIISM
eukprot:CFRG1378T1